MGEESENHENDAIVSEAHYQKVRELHLMETPWGRAVAFDEGVQVSVISTALFGRFESRIDADYADRTPLGHEKAVWRA